MLFGLILTLCYSSTNFNDECYETIPETFYSMDDCVEVLQQLDKQHPTANELFACKKVED